MIYFSSDHHFGHKNCIKYSNRPFKTLHEMDKEMIRRWNSVVKPADTVYHLGDFALVSKSYINMIKLQLNGTIKIVRGNHDRTASSLIKYGFIPIGEGRHVIDGTEFRLSHRPRNGIKFKPRETWNIHGHVHRDIGETHHSIDFEQKRINVNVEFWGYYPVSIERLRDIINKAPYYT